MIYKRFEELPVWNDAIALAADIFVLMERASQGGGIRDQIQRAAVSVSNNIAEGFERGTKAELVNFLYIARGSAGEVRSMLHLIERRGNNLEAAPLRGRCESISRQLYGWAQSLQSSMLEGQRDFDARKRRLRDRQRQRAEFLDELQKMTRRENRDQEA